jgi:hypothetical protein
VFDSLEVKDWQSRTSWTRMIHLKQTAGQPRNENLVVLVVDAFSFSFPAMRSRYSMMMMKMKEEEEVL